MSAFPPIEAVGSPFHGRHRSARVQRFQARNSAAAKLAKKKSRKAARKARRTGRLA